MSEIKKLETTSMLDYIFSENLSVLFKHSMRCPISGAAKKEFEKFAESFNGDGTLFILDVINNKDISREIEKRTGIVHESPQVLILKKGKVIWHTSHWNISEKVLKKAME